jgi:hypothetical protein
VLAKTFLRIGSQARRGSRRNDMPDRELPLDPIRQQRSGSKRSFGARGEVARIQDARAPYNERLSMRRATPGAAEWPGRPGRFRRFRSVLGQ